MSVVLEGQRQFSSAVADAAPPNLPPSTLRSLAEMTYGLAGELSSLPSERDQIAVLSIRGQKAFTLHISGPSEPLEILELQNQALNKIETDDPDLPVPRVCHSLRQRLIEEFSESGCNYHARLLSFVPGVPLRDQPRCSDLYADLGRCLGRLDRVLRGLSIPPMKRTLLWDVQQALRLSPLLRHVRGAEQRSLVETVFNAMAGHVLVKLASLPLQIIHNDFNPKNVLVDPASPKRVCGIIDFGDITQAPAVVDLGVAIARHIDLPDPLVAACTIAAGYNSTLPLSENEIDILFYVVCARLAMRTVIWSWRLDANDARCDPAQIVNAVALLRILSARGADSVTEMFRQACRKGHHDGAVEP